MGLLTNKFVKNEKNRLIIGIIKDVVIITLFLVMIFLHQYEWYEGFNACKSVCIVFPELNATEEQLFDYFHNNSNLTINFTNFTVKSVR